MACDLFKSFLEEETSNRVGTLTGTSKAITACVALTTAAYWAGQTFCELLETFRFATYDGPEDKLQGFAGLPAPNSLPVPNALPTPNPLPAPNSLQAPNPLPTFKSQADRKS